MSRSSAAQQGTLQLRQKAKAREPTVMTTLKAGAVQPKKGRCGANWPARKSLDILLTIDTSKTQTLQWDARRPSDLRPSRPLRTDIASNIINGRRPRILPLWRWAMDVNSDVVWTRRHRFSHCRVQRAKRRSDMKVIAQLVACVS